MEFTNRVGRGYSGTGTEYGVWWLPPWKDAQEIVYDDMDLEHAQYLMDCVKAVAVNDDENYLGDWGMVQREPGGEWRPYIDNSGRSQ